jgi:hypothetical protein
MQPEGGGCLFLEKEGGGGTVGLFLDRGYRTASPFLERGLPPGGLDGLGLTFVHKTNETEISYSFKCRNSRGTIRYLSSYGKGDSGRSKSLPAAVMCIVIIGFGTISESNYSSEQTERKPKK